MPNLQLVVSNDGEQGQPSSWRSFGSIASSLLARAEGRQAEAASAEEFRFAPVAWAAE